MVTVRKLPVDDLVAELVSEHAQMRQELERARGAIVGGDFATAKKELEKADATFRQHIADEEGQILRLLLESYPRGECEEAIRVFRQHRPIYVLIESLGRFSRLSPAEIGEVGGELLALLDAHALAEESGVYPKALNAAKRGTNAP